MPKTDYFEMPCPYGFDNASERMDEDRNSIMMKYGKMMADMFVKNDSDKPRYSLIPPLAEEAMAKVLTFGAQKYSADNWRNVDDLSRYVDAAMRHIGAYRSKAKFDDESGVHHLAHAMCCLAFIVELDMENMI